MDISRQAEIVLRNEGYRTWSLYEGSTLVICFENVSLIGFLCVFDSADALLHRWRETQNSILRRRREPLRTAREKAWNVYFVFRVFRNPGGKSGSPGDTDGVEIEAAEMKVDGVAESLAVAEAAR